ncbi:MAG TPA: hypothetical protein DCR14_03505 [Acidimicrobiaceae bacterium]|nr:hypothetical protein [Acidimicrobiaceae bacterium]
MAVDAPIPARASLRSAAVLLALSILIGSVAFTFVKLALEELSPIGLATGRVVASALMFTAIVSFTPTRRHPIPKGERWRVLFCGFGGSAGFHILFNLGQEHVSVAMAAVVMSTMPVMTALGEVLFLGHRLTRAQMAGLALTTAGCTVIGVASGTGAVGGSSPLGLLVIAIATAVWAAVSVVTRGLGPAYDSWWLNTPGTLLGALVMLAIHAPHLGEFGELSLRGWLLVIWLGTASSAFIYFAFARVMTAISATTAMSVSTIVTPLSMLVAWIALDDPPGPVEVVAGAVVIAGVIIVGRREVAPTPLEPAPVP